MANPNDLITDIRLNINTNNQPKKNDARKLNSGSGRGENYRNIHDINFTSVAKLGLGLKQVRMANELVGAYTGDRLTQRRFETGQLFAQYGVGVAVAGPIGVFYAAGDLAYRAANFQIARSRNNQIARKIKDLSGNNARNMSRNSGNKL